MNNIPKPSEVWYAHIPKEENPNDVMRNRPCVIVDNDDSGEVLIIKLTTHEPREYDRYDVVLKDWQKCGLSRESTARVSKIQKLCLSQFDNFKGELSQRDKTAIIDALSSYLNS